MTTVTCPTCSKTWSFEPGIEPPEGWQHGHQEDDVTARDLEEWVPTAVKELNGKSGTYRWMRNNSSTIRGAHLALDEAEFATFLGWVKKHQIAQGKSGGE